MEPQIAQTISDLSNIAAALKQKAADLDAGIVELTALYNTLPVTVPGLVIGAGRYQSNPNLLTADQLKDIVDNAEKGNLVLVVLYQDLFRAGSVIARCIGAQDGFMPSTKTNGVWLRCVTFGKHESVVGNVFLVKDPPKQVWGWAVYEKLVGA